MCNLYSLPIIFDIKCSSNNHIFYISKIQWKEEEEIYFTMVKVFESLKLYLHWLLLPSENFLSAFMFLANSKKLFFMSKHMRSSFLINSIEHRFLSTMARLPEGVA